MASPSWSEIGGGAADALGGPLLLLEAGVVVPGLVGFLVLLVPFLALALIGVVVIGVPVGLVALGARAYRAVAGAR